MAIEDKKQPIIVKKKKVHGHGHHGGSWKVAYADFVTAMMAFFLLMWLLGSTSQAQREGIADWFKNPAAPQGPGGASTSMIKFGGAMEVPRGEGDPFKQAKIETAESNQDEKARLDELMERIKEQIESTPSLKDFKDQLLLDITSEGLRIQIVDKENRPMFDLGGTRLKPYTQVILRELAKTIDQVPNFVSVSGHTDATPYVSGRTDYGNWELSADRANTARREMIAGGIGAKKFGRVVGLADSVMFKKDEPYAPVNRRISIIVLNKATQKAIGLPITDEPKASPLPAEQGASADDGAQTPGASTAPQGVQKEGAARTATVTNDAVPVTGQISPAQAPEVSDPPAARAPAPINIEEDLKRTLGGTPPPSGHPLLRQ